MTLIFLTSNVFKDLKLSLWFTELRICKPEVFRVRDVAWKRRAGPASAQGAQGLRPPRTRRAGCSRGSRSVPVTGKSALLLKAKQLSSVAGPVACLLVGLPALHAAAARPVPGPASSQTVLFRFLDVGSDFRVSPDD